MSETGDRVSEIRGWNDMVVTLEGSGLPIDVVTDHKNLEYFATTKLLT
jgi:hypothetical protein